MGHLHLPRWQAIYELPASNYEEAKKIAHGIAVEQTIEYPYELVVGTWFADEMTGLVEDISPTVPGKWKAKISYPSEPVRGEFLELLNMLYGNSSLQPGIRLLDFNLTPELFEEYPGAKFGIAGLRKRWAVPKGPLLMAVLKPMGHSTKDFAAMAYAFAKGGFHTIKDDHSLHDQEWSRFRDRVRACVDAVLRANAETGHKTVYLANVTAQGSTVLERAYFAQEEGACGVMISPSLVGWGMVRELSMAKDFHIPIVLHPSFSGAFIRSKETGMEPHVYNGYLPRLAGADGVIFTGSCGRFSFPLQDCLNTQRACLQPWGGVPAILPAIGGGMNYAAIPDVHKQYGNDIMLLVGGDLFRPGPDLQANAARFREETYRVYGV